MLKKAVCWILQFENVIASNKSKEFNPNDVTITKTQEQQLACSFEICKWHTGIYDLDQDTISKNIWFRISFYFSDGDVFNRICTICFKQNHGDYFLSQILWN